MSRKVLHLTHLDPRNEVHLVSSGKETEINLVNIVFSDRNES